MAELSCIECGIEIPDDLEEGVRFQCADCGHPQMRKGDTMAALDWDPKEFAEFIVAHPDQYADMVLFLATALVEANRAAVKEHQLQEALEHIDWTKEVLLGEEGRSITDAPGYAECAFLAWHLKMSLEESQRSVRSAVEEYRALKALVTWAFETTGMKTLGFHNRRCQALFIDGDGTPHSLDEPSASLLADVVGLKWRKP